MPDESLHRLQAMVATAVRHNAEEAATRVLPAVVPLAVDPVQEVRHTALAALDVFVQILRDHNRTLDDSLTAAGGLVRLVCHNVIMAHVPGEGDLCVHTCVVNLIRHHAMQAAGFFTSLKSLMYCKIKASRPLGMPQFPQHDAAFAPVRPHAPLQQTTHCTACRMGEQAPPTRICSRQRPLGAGLWASTATWGGPCPPSASPETARQAARVVALQVQLQLAPSAPAPLPPAPVAQTLSSRRCP